MLRPVIGNWRQHEPSTEAGATAEPQVQPALCAVCGLIADTPELLQTLLLCSFCDDRVCPNCRRQGLPFEKDALLANCGDAKKAQVEYWDYQEDNEEHREQIFCYRCHSLQLPPFCLVCGEESVPNKMLNCTTPTCRSACHTFCLDNCNVTSWTCPLCEDDYYSRATPPLPSLRMWAREQKEIGGVPLQLRVHETEVPDLKVTPYLNCLSDALTLQSLLRNNQEYPTSLNHLVHLINLADKQTSSADRLTTEPSSKVYTGEATASELHEGFSFASERVTGLPLKNFITAAAQEERLRDWKAPSSYLQWRAYMGALASHRTSFLQQLQRDCEALVESKEEDAESTTDTAGTTPDAMSEIEFVPDPGVAATTLPDFSCSCVMAVSIPPVSYAVREAASRILKAVDWHWVLSVFIPRITQIYRDCASLDPERTRPNIKASWRSLLADPSGYRSRWEKMFQLTKRRVYHFENLPLFFKFMLRLLDRLIEICPNNEWESINTLQDLLQLDRTKGLSDRGSNFWQVLAMGFALSRRLTEQVHAVFHHRQLELCEKEAWDGPKVFPAPPERTLAAEVDDEIKSLENVEKAPLWHLTQEISEMFNKQAMYPPLELYESTVEGIGLRAVGSIPARTIICEYRGIVEPKRWNLTTLSNRSNAIFNLLVTKKSDTSLSLVPEPFTNIARFVNHASDSRRNVVTRTVMAGGQPRIFFSTLKLVQPGDRLYIDYNAGSQDEYPTDDF